MTFGQSLAWEGPILRTKSLPAPGGVPAVAAEILDLGSGTAGGLVGELNAIPVDQTQARQNEVRGGTVPGMAFIDGFMPPVPRLTGVSPTMWQVTAVLATGWWCAGRES
jgi:hypothetical protein